MTKKGIVGGKIRLEYFDQNEDFARSFPAQTCDVIQRFSSTDGADNWFLLKLDKPFTYEGIENTHLLVRSRWRESEIGGKEPTSVFILLVSDKTLLKDPLDIASFRHVAWGMAYAMQKV